MRRILLVPTVASLGALPLSAQSTLYRPPDLGGTWVPYGGVVQFDFVHRFYVASSGLAVSVEPAYNFAAHSADGELSVD